MTNEVLLVIFLLTNLTFLFIVASFLRERAWMFGVILLNAFLVSIFGSKLVDIFGFITSAGNIPYAIIFLATQILLIKEKKEKDVYQIIFFYVAFIAMFVILTQMLVAFVAMPESLNVNVALNEVFLASPHTAGASILAYIFAQKIHITVFLWLKKRMKNKQLWLRSLAAAGIGQGVDSILFFTVVFSGSSQQVLTEAVITGWVMKTFVACVGVPYLYVITRKYEKSLS